MSTSAEQDGLNEIREKAKQNSAITIGIRFTPISDVGSQRTIARYLIPALFSTYPNCKLFTGRPDIFQDLPRERIITLPFDTQKPWRNLKDRWFFRKRLERTFSDHGCNIVYYPFTYEYIFGTTKLKQVVTVHDLIALN